MDDFHVTKSNFEGIPFPTNMQPDHFRDLINLSTQLRDSMDENTVFKLNAGKRIGNYNLAKCRAVTDISDIIWAKELGMEDLWWDIELAYSQIVKTDFGSDGNDEATGTD